MGAVITLIKARVTLVLLIPCPLVHIMWILHLSIPSVQARSTWGRLHFPVVRRLDTRLLMVAIKRRQLLLMEYVVSRTSKRTSCNLVLSLLHSQCTMISLHTSLESTNITLADNSVGMLSR